MEEQCAFFHLTINTFGLGPAALEMVADLFDSLGSLEKKMPFSATGLFRHPDGVEVRVKARLVNEPKLGLLLEVHRVAGDCVFFVLLYRYLQLAVKAHKDGTLQPDLAFSRGELVPPAPRIKTSADPCCDVPELVLDDLSTYSIWGCEAFEDFSLGHPEITAQVRDRTVSRATFREHVALVPETVLRHKGLPKTLTPCMGACERLAQIAAEGEAYFASRS
jgi:hypothetical protein